MMRLETTSPLLLKGGAGGGTRSTRRLEPHHHPIHVIRDIRIGHPNDGNITALKKASTSQVVTFLLRIEMMTPIYFNGQSDRRTIKIQYIRSDAILTAEF